MASTEVFLTQEGYNKLEKRLKELKGPLRKQVVEKIKTAKEFGDLSENAEYAAAREEQSQIESEILEIEQKLRTATIITESKSDAESHIGCVELGSRVVVKFLNKEVEYSIVGTAETDPLNNRISNESPVGSALIGKRAGDRVEAQLPKGILQITIKSVK